MNKIQVHADGASRGNPGLAGAGAVINIYNKIHHLSFFLGTKTNNEAEYLAVLLSLLFIDRLSAENDQRRSLAGSEVVFLLDSKLVVEQMSGRWKIKEQRMKALVDQCNQVKESLKINLVFLHIGRDHNKQADWLANQAIDLTTGS